MKKLKFCIAVLVMLTVLLWTASASGEVCIHANCEELSNLSRCEDVFEGHQTVDFNVSKCLDCGAKVTKTAYGALQGHIFHMAESLHFTDAALHIRIFICQDCQHLLILKDDCQGGQECLIYQPQAGEMPEVEYLDGLSAWEAEYSQEEVIQRWLENQKTE